MTTSGTSAFSLTVRDIITTSLEENRIIALGEEPTASELNACIRRFNGMIKTWQARGVQWKQSTVEQAIIADIAQTDLPDGVRGVNAARYKESTINERQMVRFERDEYKSLPNKTASGVSTVYYVERLTDGLKINVWPVPREDAILLLDIDEAMDTITNANETVDMPEEWVETLYSCLAVRIAGIFGAEITQELSSRAQISEREMFDSYRPASYFMGADYA